ncbi:membrane hypothetical protein [metagenome]|uniref:Uncharacterized protein n=1 Tax=metagenome TaxID=256318 RepID=A0A2P2C5P3_9ZZZZ
MADDSPLGFKQLLLARDGDAAAQLRAVQDLSQLAEPETHTAASHLVAQSIQSDDADTDTETELRRAVLTAVCIARGLLDTDLQSVIEENRRELDLDELARSVIQDQGRMWEGLRTQETALLRAGQVAPPTPTPTGPELRGFAAFVAWVREMFSPPDEDAEEGQEDGETSQSSVARLDVLRLVDALEQNLLEKEVLPALRLGINEQLGEMRGTTLPRRLADGLGQLANQSRQVDTEGIGRLERYLSTLSTGALGVAGPRGAGKTTLLESLAAAEGPSGDPRTFRYRCLATAPTRYDAREFLLHLTQEVCAAVLRELPAESPRPSSAAWPRLSTWLPLIPLGLFVVAVGLVTGSFTDRTVAVGAMLVAVAAELVGAVFLWWGWAWPYRTVTLYLAGLLGAGGLALIAAAYFSYEVDPPLAWAAAALYTAGASVVIFALWPGYTVRLHHVDDDDIARRRAQALYDSTRYQMSFSSATNASLSMDLKPVGASVGKTEGVTRSSYPESLPNVVKNFRTFVDFVSTPSSRTLIIIDELDKMATPQDTAAFLNDIKGVFGIDNAIFVLSVSVDALASFERRGLQARDEIDSSFDDVVRIDPLSLAASIELLDGRVPRVPAPYWALCFALTGGLGRDLIRSARALFDLGRHSTLDLATASAGLVGADLHARALGTLETLSAQADARPDLAFWAHRVSKAESFAELRTLVLAVPLPQHGSKPAKPAKPTSADDQAARLCAQAYLGATVVEVFVDRPYAEFQDALRPTSPRYLGKLGDVRLLLPLSVDAAWLAVDEIRKAWGLEPWPARGSTNPIQ